MAPIDTDVKRVRLLISDVGGESGNDYIFDDDEIQAFLDMRASNVHKAAASACRTMAVNEAIVSKRIRILELSTDGPAVAKELRELAATLEKASNDDASTDAVFGIGDMSGVDQFSARRARGLES